jgi:Transcription elongation factor, GreA/GreB, C-term
MEHSDEQSEIMPGPVAIGTSVEVELVSQDGEADRLAFTIVADEQADFAAGFLGAGTPLAKAILGQPVGAEVPYAVADMRSVRILAAAESGQTPAEDVAARREAVVRQAVNQSNLINALMVATSVNNKWGDYDVDGPAPENWKAKE